MFGSLFEKRRILVVLLKLSPIVILMWKRKVLSCVVGFLCYLMCFSCLAGNLVFSAVLMHSINLLLQEGGTNGSVRFIIAGDGTLTQSRS